MQKDDYREENPDEETQEPVESQEAEETEEVPQGTTDWEAEAKKWKAIADRNKKKVEKSQPQEDKPSAHSQKNDKPSDLDYGLLAFHNTKQGVIRIEDPDDVEFLKQTLAETGKSQDSILNSKWFAAELKERQEARASSNAVPKGKPRSGQPISSNLDEAMAEYKRSGKLPADFETRNKLVDKLTDKENSSMFNGPSVGPA